MPAGLQVWDANGDLIIDVTTRLVRFLGIISADASGAITVPEFATGIPFARQLTGISSKLPWITISGTQLSWNGPHTIVYGVY